jgi:hypothetical protein
VKTWRQRVGRYLRSRNYWKRSRIPSVSPPNTLWGRTKLIWLCSAISGPLESLVHYTRLLLRAGKIPSEEIVNARKDIARWLQDLERIDPFRKERYRELGQYEFGEAQRGILSDLRLYIQLRSCKRSRYEQSFMTDVCNQSREGTAGSIGRCNDTRSVGASRLFMYRTRGVALRMFSPQRCPSYNIPVVSPLYIIYQRYQAVGYVRI